MTSICKPSHSKFIQMLSLKYLKKKPSGALKVFLEKVFEGIRIVVYPNRSESIRIEKSFEGPKLLGQKSEEE